jgi:hypothetical protein
MIPPSYTIKNKVWLYSGQGAWHFVSVPPKVSKQIKSMFGYLKAGWGSLPVNLTIGKTTWQTSIFPDSKSATYLIPLKAAVRKKENIALGDTVEILIEFRV